MIHDPLRRAEEAIARAQAPEPEGAPLDPEERAAYLRELKAVVAGEDAVDAAHRQGMTADRVAEEYRATGRKIPGKL